MNKVYCTICKKEFKKISLETHNLSRIHKEKELKQIRYKEKRKERTGQISPLYTVKFCEYCNKEISYYPTHIKGMKHNKNKIIFLDNKKELENGALKQE